jgi:sulfur transfer complex TusBCD TusB component (DsrH family)
MNRFRCLLALLTCLVLVAFAQAQDKPALGTTHVTLGPSVVPLYGPWKFTVGDSPIDPATHAPLWAQPDFDDSHWETVDLTPQGTLDPLGGFSNYVKGWTARGHAGYSGYAWYRIRVQVAGQPGEKLAMAGPSYVDDAYQLFSDGTLVGSFGSFTGSQPSFYFTQPMMFNLPPPSAASPIRVLAFRFWMAPDTLVTQADTGGMHTAPLLGDAGAVEAGYQLRWLEPFRAQIAQILEGLLFLLLAGVAFSLTRFDRSDAVYVWMGSVFLLLVANAALTIIGTWTQTISAITELLLQDGLLNPLLLGAWVMVWWVWFRLERPTWLPKAVALLTLGFMVSSVIGENLLYPLISTSVADIFHTVSIAVRLALLMVLILVVIWGIRRQGAEGWFVLPAVVLLIVSLFTEELLLLHIRINWFPFGLRFSLAQAANVLLTAVLFVLLLRRLLLSVRQQRLLALDVKQAQEVQRVILPETVTAIPGLTIENEYRPAREVGGDFNQIIPHSADGSLLIVAGDVAGKGLQAGMLVALLVGAIRMAEEVNPDPLFILQALNRRMLGRGEAHATCLAMRIAADGAVTLANAGHLPPYLNGKPVEVEGALPLGVIDNAGFTITHFQLQENDRLLLTSDGIVEAMDEEGRLFGFERLQELLQSRLTAAEVATAAQNFGQQDDISVIAVTRTAELVPA